MNSKFYKSEADRLLAVNDRKTEFVKITLVLMLINVVITAVIPPLASLVVAPMVSLVFARTAYKIYCNKDIAINDIFSDFSKILDVILYNLITFALVLLGTILFIIPGIIIGFRLSLGYYIMADEPEISFGDALKKSAEMMKGNCWKYFKLQLSFFGWYILIGLTLGILSLWVMPRIQTANMVFYATLKKELYGEDITGKAAATEANSPFENVFNGNDAAERPQYYNPETPYSQPAHEPQQTAYTPAADVAPAPAAEAETFEAPAYNVPEVTDVTNTDNLN